MRTLRTVALPALLLVSLGLAGTAGANSITATWIATSANYAVGLGTSTLGILPGNTGETVVLRITVNASAAGVNAVGVTFQYFPGFFISAAETRCPAAPGNLVPLICGTNLSGLLSTNSNAVNVPGLIGGVQTDGLPPGGQNTPFTFAHMTFTVGSGFGGGTTGNLFLRPGIDGIVTTDAEFVIPSLGPAIIYTADIPEPATIALLALGLGVLGFAGRRR